MRFGETPVETISVRSNERLSGLSKEFHNRKNTAYIVEDKLQNYLILSQRIEDVVNSINRIVEYEPDRVTLSGIYYALGRTASRTGGYVKNRWRVQPIDIDMTMQAFENIRQNRRFQNVMIVGRQMSAYKLARV